MDELEIYTGDLTHEQLVMLVGRLCEDVGTLKREFASIHANALFMADPLLDSATVCQFLSMSYRQLKTYKQRGDIVPLHNGTKCLYPTSEVRRFVEQVLKVKGHKLKTNIIERVKIYENG